MNPFQTGGGLGGAGGINSGQGGGIQAGGGMGGGGMGGGMFQVADAQAATSSRTQADSTEVLDTSTTQGNGLGTPDSTPRGPSVNPRILEVKSQDTSGLPLGLPLKKVDFRLKK
jgi:hypothetical protein